jgi:putative transposase
MPRQARIDMPGLLQHVMVRGIEGRNIFEDDSDRKSFLKRFSLLLRTTDTRCYAWALLPNHAHFLLLPERSKLSLFMRRLLTGHAVQFNRRHQRSGHLFQNRFKSIICENDPYLLELVRYIHLNPLRANLVQDMNELDEFPWCGHSVLLGKRHLDGQKVNEVLSLFALRLNSGRRLYRQFIQDGMAQGQREDLSGSRKNIPVHQSQDDIPNDGRILGTTAFIEELQEKHGRSETMPARISLPELLRRVANYYGVGQEELCQRSQAVAIRQGRDVFCYLATRMLHFPGPEVGEFLHIKRSAVSHAVQRGAEIVRADDGIRRKIIT